MKQLTCLRKICARQALFNWIFHPFTMVWRGRHFIAYVWQFWSCYVSSLRRVFLPIKPGQLSHLHFKNCIKKYSASIFIVGLISVRSVSHRQTSASRPDYVPWLRSMVYSFWPAVCSLDSPTSGQDGPTLCISRATSWNHNKFASLGQTPCFCNWNAMKILNELTFLLMFFR